MQLYKPTKSNKGAALSINFSAKTNKGNEKGDKSFYFQLVSQNGWNESTGNGVFKDGKKIITKFAPHEIAGMLAAIKRNISMADAMNTKYVYHDGEKFSSNINFEPYFKSEKKGNEWVKSNVQAGFSLRVTKTEKQNEQNKDSIGIAFNWAEVELLRVVLEDGLQHIANSWYAENIARGTEAKEKAKKSAPKQEQKPEEKKAVIETNPEDEPPGSEPDLDF